MTSELDPNLELSLELNSELDPELDPELSSGYLALSMQIDRTYATSNLLAAKDFQARSSGIFQSIIEI